MRADLSGWVEYFCLGVADAFASARARAVEAARTEGRDQETPLRKLDARQRQVAALFETEPYVTTKQIAEHLGLHRRTALNLCKAWVEDGFLVQHGTRRKAPLPAGYCSSAKITGPQFMSL